MKKVFRIMLAVCLTVLLAFTFVACGNNDKTPDDGNDNKKPPVVETPTTVTIAFAQSSLDIVTGTTQNIEVTVTGSDETVKFSTSSARTVTVTSTGKNTATIEALRDGEATITAAIGDVKATLAVKAITKGIKVEGGNVYSVARGETNSFNVTLQNITGAITATSDIAGITATVKTGETAETATVEFTGAADLELGKTATITVKADNDYTAQVEVDTYSKGILYGDGNYQARYQSLNEFGIVARGVGSDFEDGALVIPRRAYYTPDKNIDKFLDADADLSYGKANESFWATISFIGTRTNEKDGDCAKFKDAAPFYIEDGKTINALNTGDSAQAVCEKAFENVTSITKVHLGKNIYHICDEAFKNNAGFTKNGGEENYTYTFNGTVDELTFDPEGRAITIGISAFETNKLTKLILPDNTATIASYAFWQCGTEILKLPAAWTKANFSLNFYDINRLKELYIPWQNMYALADDYLVESNFEGNSDYKKVEQHAQAVALAEELGLKESEYIHDGHYYNFNFCHQNLLINGKKGALINNNIKVYYLGDKRLMDNALSVTNYILYGDIWEYSDGTYGFDYKDGSTVGWGHDGTTNRQTAIGSVWYNPVGENFRETFMSTEEITTKYGTPATVYKYGNDKVEWIFGQTCPYNVDGTSNKTTED